MKPTIFDAVAVNRAKRSTFDLSHQRKTSFQMGQLVPVMVEEALPNDNWTMNLAQMIKFTPLVSPPYHECHVYCHAWFVATRNVWPNWPQFITGGEDGLAEPAYPYIKLVHDSLTIGRLADHIGIPVYDATTGPAPATREIEFSAVPFAAYASIYNHNYRDQNLANKLPDLLTDGDNTVNLGTLTDGQLARRCWNLDYFTACLPTAQKGDAATLPLGGYAPIEYQNPVSGLGSQAKSPSTGIPFGPTTQITLDATGRIQDPAVGQFSIDNSDALYANLSSATAALITDLRTANALQRFLERRMLTGGRYDEYLRADYGVSQQDARLNQPEYIGGSKGIVTFSEVLQTSATNAEPTPAGTMVGHGMSVGSGTTLKYNCKEHGFIIVLVSVMPKSGYFQGIPRKFFKFDRFDHHNQFFEFVGEQEVLNQELYITDDEGKDLEGFGYINRYAEYKVANNSLHGNFRSDRLDWTIDRKFETPPALNASFMWCTPRKDIFAIRSSQSEDLYCYVNNQVTVSREMSYFSTPKL